MRRPVAGDVGRLVARVLGDVIGGLINRHARIRATADVLVTAGIAYGKVLGTVLWINRAAVAAIRDAWR